VSCRIFLHTSSIGVPSSACFNTRNLLRASGYRPEQVDLVLITHLHADHVGGVMVHGKPAYPNAVIRVSQADADYWLSSVTRNSAPAFLRPMFDGAQKVLAPYLCRRFGVRSARG